MNRPTQEELKIGGDWLAKTFGDSLDDMRTPAEQEGGMNEQHAFPEPGPSTSSLVGTGLNSKQPEYPAPQEQYSDHEENQMPLDKGKGRATEDDQSSVDSNGDAEMDDLAVAFQGAGCEINEDKVDLKRDIARVRAAFYKRIGKGRAEDANWTRREILDAYSFAMDEVDYHWKVVKAYKEEVHDAVHINTDELELKLSSMLMATYYLGSEDKLKCKK